MVSGACVSVLRLLSLLFAAFAVAGAQYLFRKVGQSPLFPPEFVATAPFFARIEALAPEDLRNLGYLLAVIGALLFGEGAVRWPRRALRGALGKAQVQPDASARRRLHPILQGVGLVLAGGLLIHLWRGGIERTPLHMVWLLALVMYLLGSARGDALIGRATGQTRPSPSEAPERAWPLLLLILLAVVVLTGWRLSAAPLRVDGDVASHGLQALEIATGQETRLFAPGWANIPLLAYYPAALGMLLSGDWLVGNRLAGVYAGVLTIFGVWLLGCELFRRAPSPTGTTAEQGHPTLGPLFAAALTAIGYTFVHFSRLPEYLEPVAWGTLSLWALHRGVRTGQRLPLALSGLLLGMAGVFYYSGRVFYVVAGAWWLGLLLTRRDWLRPLGWAGVGVWLGGLFVFLAPFAGVWLAAPQAFLTRMQEVSILRPDALVHMQGVYGVQGLGPVLLENARRAALTFFIYPDTSTHFGWRGPLLDMLNGGLLLLGIGYLLLNLDRLMSWLLLSWFLVVLFLGGVMTTNTPFWPRFLPVLPVIGLITGLTSDRWLATLREDGGPWLESLGRSALIGLLVLVGISNWVAYYEWSSVHNDPASAVGRGVRILPDGVHVYLLDTGEPGRPHWGERTVEFLAGGPVRAIVRETLSPSAWPDRLPPNSAVLLLPEDQALAPALQTRYPGGVYMVQRNRRGDPILFIYRTPNDNGT